MHQTSGLQGMIYTLAAHVRGSQPLQLPYILIFDFLVLTPMMVGIMAEAIKSLSGMAEKLSAAGHK